MSRTSRNIRRGLIGLAAVITVACGGAPAYTTTTEYLSSGGGSQAAVDEAVLDMVWDGLSAVEQAELCAEVRIAGPRAAARIVTSEATSFSPSQVEDKLAEWCL